MDKNSQLLEFLNAPDETLKKWCGVSLKKRKKEQTLLKKFYRKMFHNEKLSCEEIKVINNKFKNIHPILCLMEESVPGVFKEAFSNRRGKT